MHKTMFKISVCLLLLSAIIYACGEYTATKREIQKLKTWQNFGQADLAKKAMAPAPKKIKPIEVPEDKPLVIDIQDKKFLEVKGLKPPSDSKVKAGILAELSTGAPMWAKNVDKKIAIASLSKVMTVLVVLDELDKRKDIDFATKIKITSTARSTRSSSFLRKHPLPEVTVEECLQSALIKSANDSCVLLAEFFGGGDAKRFVAMMNSKARMLKMTDTAFYNPHGLPGAYYDPVTPDNTSTIKDLMLMVINVYEKRKGIFKWSRLKSLTLPKNHSRAIIINNTNPLIEVEGVIGLKTGFTNNAGWCLINVDSHQGKVYVSIITGCVSKADRNAFARSLLLWSRKAGKVLK